MPLADRLRLWWLRRQRWWPHVLAALIAVGKWLQGDPEVFPYPELPDLVPPAEKSFATKPVATFRQPQATRGPAGNRPFPALASCRGKPARSAP